MRMTRPRLAWADLLAGLSLAGLLLPEAVAYSSIANLPPQAGVVALVAGLFTYALLGTSRFAIVASTSSAAAVLAAASAALASDNPMLRFLLAGGLVLATGVLFLLAGVARLGGVSDFIARPVLRGFSFGLALIIIVRQLATAVAVPLHHADLARALLDLTAQFPQWHWLSLWLTAAALLLLFLCARVPYLPGGLVVIALGIAAGKWGDLAGHGVAMVGTIALHLSAPALLALPYSAWARVAELSMALVLILYAESSSSVRTFAIRHGDDVAPNRDLLALGAANLLSGLFHGMPVGAGFSGTSANEAAGATSRWAGAFAGAAVLLAVVTLLPWIALAPQPVLAAIVIHAVSHMLRPGVFRPYWLWRKDRLVVVAAVLAVLALGVLDGLLAAVGVSFFMLLRRLSHASVTLLGRLGQGHDFVSMAVHPDASAVDGMVVMRPDTELFFANAERMLAVARRLVNHAGAQARIVVISLEESPDLDSTAIEAVAGFCRDLQAQGRSLMFARLKPPAQRALLRAAIPGLGAACLVDLSVDDAVLAAQGLVDGSAQPPASPKDSR